jgi:hypothetical protein
MTLDIFLSQKRSTILEKWFGLIVETYPVDSQRFLKKQKNRFANPVGYTISKEMAAIYDELRSGVDSDRVSTFLDRIIRIRAIQDFSPSQAIAFIFLLKKVIREELENESWEGGVADELWRLENKIDLLAMLSFDIYMKCREKIYQLRANEVKKVTYGLLRRANLIWENPALEPDLKNDTSDDEPEAR